MTSLLRNVDLNRQNYTKVRLDMHEFYVIYDVNMSYMTSWLRAKSVESVLWIISKLRHTCVNNCLEYDVNES